MEHSTRLKHSTHAYEQTSPRYTCILSNITSLHVDTLKHHLAARLPRHDTHFQTSHSPTYDRQSQIWYTLRFSIITSLHLYQDMTHTFKSHKTHTLQHDIFKDRHSRRFSKKTGDDRQAWAGRPPCPTPHHAYSETWHADERQSEGPLHIIDIDSQKHDTHWLSQTSSRYFYMHTWHPLSNITFTHTW